MLILLKKAKQTALKVVEKDALDWVVRPLAQSIDTSKETLGFTEANRYIIAKLNLNVNLKDINDIEVKIDNECIENLYIYNLKNILAIKLQIPKEIEPTLYGEESLREKHGNYFDVRKEQIGERKSDPHILEVQFIFEGKEYKEQFAFDTLDTLLSNINSNVSNAITNNEGISLDEWLERKE